MKIQVIVTRTDTAATTKLVTNSGESSKNYASWNDALKEPEGLKLIKTVEATAAKALPPGFPLHTTTEVDAGTYLMPASPRAKPHHLNDVTNLPRRGRYDAPQFIRG